MHAKSTYHNFGIFDGVWFYNQNVVFCAYHTKEKGCWCTLNAPCL